MQLSISIRSVDDCFGIHEDCLGLYELESQNDAHITAVIIDVLLRCNLNLNDCRGQGYDGAATMSGIHDGVAAKLRKNHGMPCLELNTCVAHRYALVGKHEGQYLDGQ